MGHEMAGEVVDAAATAPFAAGDRVIIDPELYCGACFHCRIGQTHLCPNGILLGRDANGGFAEFVSAPASQVFRLPEAIDSRAAPMIQVLTTCLHAQRQVDIFPGEYVVVLGLGVTGQLHVQLAKARGATVIGVTRSADKRALAETLGADLTIPGGDDAVERVREATEGRGADVVIETTGVVPSFVGRHSHGALRRPAAAVRHHHRQGRRAAVLRPVFQGAAALINARVAKSEDYPARDRAGPARHGAARAADQRRDAARRAEGGDRHAGLGQRPAHEDHHGPLDCMIYLVTQTLNGLFSAALLFLIASGLTLAFGVMRIVNIAHGSFYMLGVYVAYTVIRADRRACVLGAVAAVRRRRRPSASSMQRLFLRRFAAQPLRADDDDDGVRAAVSRRGADDLGRRSVHAAVPGGAARIDGGRRDRLSALSPVRHRRGRRSSASRLWLLNERTLIGARLRATVDDPEMAAGDRHQRGAAVRLRVRRGRRRWRRSAA